MGDRLKRLCKQKVTSRSKLKRRGEDARFEMLGVEIRNQEAIVLKITGQNLR
jgi:hypothetical protein